MKREDRAYRRGNSLRVNCCTLYAKRGDGGGGRVRDIASKSLGRVMARSPPPSCETSNRLSAVSRAPATGLLARPLARIN